MPPKIFPIGVRGLQPGIGQGTKDAYLQPVVSVPAIMTSGNKLALLSTTPNYINGHNIALGLGVSTTVLAASATQIWVASMILLTFSVTTFLQILDGATVIGSFGVIASTPFSLPLPYAGIFAPAVNTALVIKNVSGAAGNLDYMVIASSVTP